MLLGTDYLTDSETLCNSGVCIMYPALTETVAYPWERKGICKQTFWKEPGHAHKPFDNTMSPWFESDLFVEASDRGAATQILVSLGAQWVFRSSSTLSTTHAHVWHGS